MTNAGLLEWVKGYLEKIANTNGGHDHLSQLTIVIPSYCRQDYLLRQIAYWSFSNATIVIVDGSPTPLASQLLDLISDVPNIKYLNLTDSYTNRLKEACRHIKTPYAMCLADDDIFLMEGLCHTIDHLNKNSEIVACIGQAIGVDYDDKKMCSYFFPYGDSLENYQVAHKDSVERIHFGINDYRTATSYAVFRAPTFKDVWHSLQMTSCLEATEYEHAIATYTLGRLATIPNVYWLRSFECGPVDSLIDGSRKLDFSTWWYSKEYKHECVDFVSRLAIKLSKNSSLKEHNASKEIMRVIDHILCDRHTGLMNENRSMMLFACMLNVLNHFYFLHKCLIKFKSTRLGGVIRNAIMAAIRGAAADPITSAKYGMTYQTSIEIKNALMLISSFHAAQRPVVK
jgi:glycosyltransferase domain-containing protein